MNALPSPVWLVFGFYCIVVRGQQLLQDCLQQLLQEFIQLYCLIAILPAFAEVFIKFYIGFFALFCIHAIIALAYALRIREGASEDDIRSLPMYRFSQSNVMVMVDDNKKQFVKTRTGSYNQSHIGELSLHPDDSVSINCVFF
ncbi:hypothetical protein TSUD_329180 [Trifolium subterraneum]|uniref:FHA domain-containing protein n=1 Tax=Trifolium subterraneum TaxID=3900 RepID=A0A2Z6LRF4_TRISU|nr:hypothetical protein TSUD_329180 [Trifolium subterraneum]